LNIVTFSYPQADRAKSLEATYF